MGQTDVVASGAEDLMISLRGALSNRMILFCMGAIASLARASILGKRFIRGLTPIRTWANGDNPHDQSTHVRFANPFGILG
jgi:hypothetical protein